MANRRTIHCSISTSESVEAMSEWAQLLWDRIILHADDYGRIDGSPAKLKATCKPLSERPPRDFGMAVAEMLEQGMVIAYRVNGHEFLCLPKFETHQTGLHKKAKPRLPTSDEGEILTASEYVASFSRRFPEIPGNSAIKKEGRKRREGKRREEKKGHDQRARAERELTPQQATVASVELALAEVGVPAAAVAGREGFLASLIARDGVVRVVDMVRTLGPPLAEKDEPLAYLNKVLSKGAKHDDTTSDTARANGRRTQAKARSGSSDVQPPVEDEFSVYEH